MGKMKRVIAAVALLSVWAVWAQAEEFTFQQGVNNYDNGQDLTIYDDDRVSPPESGSLRMSSLWPSGTEVYNTLIRFEGLGALSGTLIQDAELELTFGEDDSQEYVSAIIETYSAGKKWHDPNATWDEANGGLPWEQSGAQGVTDRLKMHGDPVNMGPRGPGNFYEDGEKFIFALDPNEVRRWVENPNENNGVLMVMDSDVSMTRVIFYSNEAAETGFRPLLRITAVPCLPIPGDINGDCYVNALDLAQMVEEWLLEENLTADLSGNGIVNLEDMAILARNWLECSKPDDPECAWTGP